jgi:hypothetical protein
MRVIQKVRFPIFYLNKVTTYRTHEAEIRLILALLLHIVPQVCLDTYFSNISICHVLHRKMCPGHVAITFLHFEHLHWSESTDLGGAFSSLGIDGSPMVPNQDCMVDVEEFPSPRSSRDSQLQHHYEVKHCHAKEEPRVLWSTILVSCTE